MNNPETCMKLLSVHGKWKFYLAQLWKLYTFTITDKLVVYSGKS